MSKSSTSLDEEETDPSILKEEEEKERNNNDNDDEECRKLEDVDAATAEMSSNNSMDMMHNSDDEELSTLSAKKQQALGQSEEVDKRCRRRLLWGSVSLLLLLVLVLVVVVAVLLGGGGVECTFPEPASSEASNNATNAANATLSSSGETSTSETDETTASVSYNNDCDPYDSNGPPCMVEGRPFRDQSGRTILAAAEQCGAVETKDKDKDDNNRWSSGYHDAASLSFPNADESLLAVDDSPNVVLKHPNEEWKTEQGQAWLEQARAEHASIASFAAFSLALLSNQAPPTLVQAALQAAQDEIRHAQISFGWASCLLGQPFEPAALPPTQHQFGPKDLVQLARGTIEEGCVGETMSTFEMVAKANAEMQGTDETHVWQQQMWRSALQIANDEARHAALAWKTIRWVCQTDPEACASGVQSTLALHPTLLAPYQNGKFPILANLWEDLYHALTPYVVGTKRPVDRVTDALCITTLDPSQWQQETTTPTTDTVPDEKAVFQHLKQSVLHHFHCVD